MPGALQVRISRTADKMIVVYTMPKGGEIALHTHAWDHWSVLVRGAAWVLDGVYDDLKRMLPGDTERMPAGMPHGFRADEDDTILMNITSIADIPAGVDSEQ